MFVECQRKSDALAAFALNNLVSWPENIIKGNPMKLVAASVIYE
jgi:hypothetical protein